MWWPWSGGSDKPTGTSTQQNEAPKSSSSQNATNDVRKKAGEFDPNKLPQREKLPPKLQKIIEKSDKEENFFDELVDG
jgi:fission process protein 1